MDPIEKPIIVAAAPSGGGKTRGSEAIMRKCRRIARVVTSTSRPMRPGEKNGEHYHFYDAVTFEHMIDRHDFLECDKPFGGVNYYGTEWLALENIWNRGYVPLALVTLPGVSAFTTHFKEACTIFICPPSFEELESRLRSDPSRNGTSDEELVRRLAQARIEMSSWWNHCRHSVVNDNLEKMADDFIAVVRKHYPSAL